MLDGARPLPFDRHFDRILVDVPCSGTGTLGRNPEIKWRLTPADLEDLPRRQRGNPGQRPRRRWLPAGWRCIPPVRWKPEENEAVVGEIPEGLVVESTRRLPGTRPGRWLLCRCDKIGVTRK